MKQKDFRSGNTSAGNSIAVEATNETVKNLLRQRADIMEKIDRIEKSYKDENSVRLAKHIRMALDGVHPGYVEADYYAPDRWYVNGYEEDGLPELEGVKNLRFRDSYYSSEVRNYVDHPVVEIKTTSPKGELLPGFITVDDVTYKVLYCRSNNYCNQIDY